MYALRSENTTGAVGACLFSMAHCWIASSIWRRLLMQAFIWLVERALMKLGIAIAASIPIMVTTIIISSSVKPPSWRVLVFILHVSFTGLCRGFIGFTSKLPRFALPDFTVA